MCTKVHFISHYTFFNSYSIHILIHYAIYIIYGIVFTLISDSTTIREITYKPNYKCGA